MRYPGDTPRSCHGLRYAPPLHLFTFSSQHFHIVIGKAEGNGPERHGHVTALTVAPEYRRLGLSRKFMAWLEKVSDENYRGVFIDLYVRCVNVAAVTMYERFGYSVYRRVKEYYSNMGLGFSDRDEVDGFGAYPCCDLCMRLPWKMVADLWGTGPDMRKPLSRDPMRRSVRANGRDFTVGAADVS